VADHPYRIAMFSGGRGTGSITEALMKHEQIDLTLLVNTYDDGLSTGALRRFVPGMLGPSDVRKNIARLIDPTDRADRACKVLLEHRFPLEITHDRARSILSDFASGSFDTIDPTLRPHALDLTLRQINMIRGWTGTFLNYLDQQTNAGVPFQFGDCSLGNLFFTGCYLQGGKSFNRAVDDFSTLCTLRGRVLNVTTGENLVLVALKKDKTYLPDEAAIVSFQEPVPIEEIFLLPRYLLQDEAEGLQGQTHEQTLKTLRSLSTTPAINPAAREALETADMIIYGPGTQHSSLFPSYITADLGTAIVKNKTAEKIFVGNIYKDYEIRNETAASLVEKFFFYLNNKGRTSFAWNDLVTLFFLQQTIPAHAQSDYVFFEPASFPYPPEKVVLTDWETSAGAHSGGRVVDEIVSVVNSKLQKRLKAFPHTVSFIIPALNEERTIVSVLKELVHLDLLGLGLGKEIIVVDGGSSDRTAALAQAVTDVRVLRLEKPLGRGAALRRGIENAGGNIIVFYPCDGEYRVKDLFQVVQEISKNEFQAVFGSRAIKCVNVSQRILDIYQGNYLLYFASKYGGMAVSFLCLALFNRYVSDAFTGIKAFDARLLKSLKLASNSLNLDTEIIAKLGQRGVFILELPVDYMPRTRKEGKKTTVVDGLRAIFGLLVQRMRHS
jgi:2-phospho-L-lactate transferase/gluconeogenesis factor (CofD/UPF0052 family)